jgi:hypothetical protein
MWALRNNGKRMPSNTRRAVALAAIALLNLGAGGCGGSRKVAASRTHASHGASASGVAGASTTSSSASTASALGYLPDGDGEIEEGVRSSGYLDLDDRRFDAYGHQAGGADRRAITAVVKRYYAATRARDGRRACSLMTPVLAGAVAARYAQAPGQSSPRGGITCPAGMRFLFEHFHTQLSARVAVTGVRVNGNHAYALLGFRTIRAGYITMHREHGAWAITVVFALGMS